MIEINLYAGVFFGACLFAAYCIGRLVTKIEAVDMFDSLLSHMDKDMDGAVTEWFTKYKEGANNE